MTVDDATTDKVEVVAGGILIIRPTTSGEEWTIHNIYVPFGGECELYRCDDITGADLGIYWGPLNVSLSGQFNFHCTNTNFMLVKNVGSTTIYVGYDGIVTRSP